MADEQMWGSRQEEAVPREARTVVSWTSVAAVAMENHRSEGHLGVKLTTFGNCLIVGV